MKPHLQGSRVLITGVSGFVGPHLAKALLDQGVTVYGLVRRRSDGNLNRGLADIGIEKQVRIIEGSVEDLTSLLSAVDRASPILIDSRMVSNSLLYYHGENVVLRYTETKLFNTIYTSNGYSILIDVSSGA